MELAESEPFVAGDGDLERRIELLALEPVGEELRAFDFKMLVLSGIVVPTLLLLWGWA